MAGAGVATEQNRLIGCCGCLQPRGHFARLSGVNTTIIFPGGQKHRRVLYAVAHMVIRRVSVKSLELLRIFYRAKFRYVELPIWVEFHSEHVIDANVAYHCPSQIRALGQKCTHEQSPIASAFDSEFGRAGIMALDQMLGRGDEIIEDVLLASQVACFVPMLAELATTAQIGHYIHSARIEPNAPSRIEARSHVDAVAAITIQQRGILSIQLQPLFAQNVERDFGSVFRSRKL